MKLYSFQQFLGRKHPRSTKFPILLELAAGNGRNAELLFSLSRKVHAFDISQQCVEKLKAKRRLGSAYGSIWRGPLDMKLKENVGIQLDAVYGNFAFDLIADHQMGRFFMELRQNMPPCILKTSVNEFLPGDFPQSYDRKLGYFSRSYACTLENLLNHGFCVINSEMMPIQKENNQYLPELLLWVIDSGYLVSALRNLESGRT